MTRDHSFQSSGTTTAPRISPTEAIRRAMAALGSSSQVPQILDYIRDNFGITGVTEPKDEGAVLSPPRMDRSEAPPLAGEEELAEEAPTADPAGKGPAPKRGKPKDRPAP